MEYPRHDREPNGDPLIVVTVTTTDPMYLRQPFVISLSGFKKGASSRQGGNPPPAAPPSGKRNRTQWRMHMTPNKELLPVCALLLCASLPALAEIDLSGSWAAINHEDALERGGGPNPVDFAGLPFNENGRAKALSFTQSIISMPERICWFQTQWHALAAGPVRKPPHVGRARSDHWTALGH